MQQELVERARRGDHDAFATLAGAAIFRLDAAARLILRDPDQAKDAVQETLVRAWRDGRLEIAVAPADGSALGKRIGPTMPKPSNDSGPVFEFSPDASAVVVAYPQEGLVRVMPVDGSDGYTLPFDGSSLPSMQRLAP